MRIVGMKAACLALALASAGPALAGSETTVVFGLYGAGAAGAPKVDTAAAGKLGCKVMRAGRIVAQDGDIGLAKPDAFVMFACSKPVLGLLGGAADGLVSGVRRLALLEGSVTAGGGRAGNSGLRDRQYIVKVRYFNNADPEARRRDLAEIGGLVAKSADRYTVEAEIDVTQALGARRPDEITILSYDDGAAGDRFRSGNPDIMGLIGRFNSRHVSGFTYYVGMAEE